MKRTFSTERVAEMVGVHWTTLHRWLRSGGVEPSIAVPLDGRTLWRWTLQDVKMVRKYKAVHYRNARGRKKAQKKSGNR
jgi:predicted site-specific integrase-resolvase